MDADDPYDPSERGDFMASADGLTRWNKHFALPQLVCVQGFHGPLIAIDHDSGSPAWVCPQCGNVQPVTPMQHLLATGAADLPLPPVVVPPSCPGDLSDGTVLLGDRVFGYYLDSRATGIAATVGLAVMFVGALVNLYPVLTLLIAIGAGSAALRLISRPTARIQHEHTLRADQLQPGMWVRIRTSLAAQVHQVVRASNTYTLTVTLGTGETRSWDSSMSVSVVELEGH